MSRISFTEEQRRAIGTLGKSVVVSAAAGAGKTAVLAERCAYLVCDAPPSQRCNADELLVLTFTDAAAAEMRSRIIQAIRSRLDVRPRDARLAEQLSLVEIAQISTIHSFCFWLIRRWFSHVGVDPAATVLGADEEALLKSEVLEGLFARLYAIRGNHTDPSRTESMPPPAPTSSETADPLVALAPAFEMLVDDYGLGDDGEIASFVLRLHDFLCSLPDPDGWLRDAYEPFVERPETLVAATAVALERELERQAEHAERVAAAIEAGHPIGRVYAVQIRAYVDQLRAWRTALDGRGERMPEARGGRWGGDGTSALVGRFEHVRQQIAAFQFSAARAPRMENDTPPAVQAARDEARDQLTWVRQTLFQTRLRERFGLFSVDELIDGLRRTAPYVGTIRELVRCFGDAYGRRKRELAVMDFADLERFAFELLTVRKDGEVDSEVARAVRRRFAYVLVDEFQDVNPIQQSIIRLASREDDERRADNLFVVGDVKQSIYRFRLAEPEVFAERLQQFRSDSNAGAVVSLQRNFRSRPEILSAVNLIFRQLMCEGPAGVVYDDDAELRPGRTDIDVREHAPVELHLLERVWKTSRGNEEEFDQPQMEHGVSDALGPERWTPIDREAFLIASSIQDWMRRGSLQPGSRPLRYRDCAILLRNARITAERLAGMLCRLGVPAFADVGGSLFGAREIRDVLAALTVLDNAQQDIPMAAVLRSGIMAESFSEDALVEIRCLNREIPFHAALRRYALQGADAGLRERVGDFLRHVDQFRHRIHRRPLADVLWSLYEHRGFLAYAGGLPNGAQRQANLLKLHELARQFGTFLRQGLHRFLRFIASLEEEDRAVAPAPPLGEAEDVVRVMTIHQAKGLEFPVVFVAGLGTKFNLRDRAGRMIFERKNKIGLRVLDTEKMIEFPSDAHIRVADEIERAAREEEMRVLYVAMTRAREKLVLVGSMSNVGGRRGSSTHQGSVGQSGEGNVPRSLSSLTITTANTPLEWLLPALQCAPPMTVRGLGGPDTDLPLVDVRIHAWEEMQDWATGPDTDDRRRALHEAIARLNPLPAEEPRSPDDGTVREVLTRLDYVYPHLPSASVRAAVAASAFEGIDDFMGNPGERPRLASLDDFTVPPSRYAPIDADDARYRGTVTHRVLQHLDFASATDGCGITAELARLVEEGLISPVDAAMVDRDALAWFVATPLAAAIRRAGRGYRREFTFAAAEPLEFFDPGIGPASGDCVLVRGMVDGILPVEGGIELVDYKTDVVAADQAAERAARYLPQMALYARAVSKLWERPLHTCRLVFLTARCCYALRDEAWVTKWPGPRSLG